MAGLSSPHRDHRAEGIASPMPLCFVDPADAIRAFAELGHNRREALKLAAGFRGEEAVDAGVTEEHALETVLEWLSPPRLMELAVEAVELYCWDRAGSDN